MKLTLLGTGDSAGVPQIGCSCRTCARYHDEGRERTRFSLLLENEGERLLVDASPDLRHQFLREGIDSVDHVLLTHAHYDHYAGLGSLYRVIWEDLPIHGVSSVLESVVEERYHYLPFTEPREVEPFERFEVAGMTLRLVRVHHPPAECYGVVVESGGSKIAVTCDTSRDVPPESVDAMRDADLLVADSFLPADSDVVYPEFVADRISDDGMSFADKHMTREGALDLADELDVDDVVLVHLSHYFREDGPPLGDDGDIYEL
ncbi:MAG: MBL fold metallo-hydrolase [Halobacteriota archaeon]